MDRAKYIKDWDMFQRRQERKFVSAFRKALQRQVQQFKEGGLDAVNSIPIYAVLLKLYKEVPVKWGAYVARQLKRKKDLGQMGVNADIVEWMRNYYGIDLINDAELMTRYSREIIAGVLSQAAEMGWSFNQIVSKLIAHPEFGAMRARRIARTETVTAANGGAMKQAYDSGLELNKEWISVNDKRTRPDHRMVDGQIVPLQGFFSVGIEGYQMAQPGVRTLQDGNRTPAKEVVNCRCTVGFIPLDL